MIKDDGVQDDGGQDDVLLPAVVLGGHHIIRAKTELWPVVLVHPHAGMVQVLQGGGRGGREQQEQEPSPRHKA